MISEEEENADGKDDNSLERTINDETAAGLHIKKYEYNPDINYDTATADQKEKNPLSGKKFTIQFFLVY